MSRTVVGVMIAVIVVFGAVTLVPVQTTLVVTDTETGEQVIETEVTDGTSVHLNYTHSVERTPITESYEVSGTKLAEEKILFRSFGAGLPATANMTVTDEGYVVHSNETYESITVALHPVPNHTLAVDERQYHLAEKSDGSVSVTVEQRSLLETAIAVIVSGHYEIGVGASEEWAHPNILNIPGQLPAID